MGFSASKLLKDPRSFASPADSAKLRAYDYVIIGGGTAGCILAHRLSEDLNVTVLLIEAGGEPPFETRVPFRFGKLLHNEEIDWGFLTVPQEHVGGRQIYWPRGKVLGGCTSINGMIAHRASPSDFDEWAQVHGCAGWSYADLKPYFERAERFVPHAKHLVVDPAQHGLDGLLRTSYAWLTEISEKGFLPACRSVGIQNNKDLDTAASSGSGASQVVTYVDAKGERSSTATAYLHSGVLARPNLTVAIQTRVTRIVFDEGTEAGCRATGIELQSAEAGPLFRVKVDNEVLVCAGTVQTPQTLMLSGIGPKTVLEQHGINVAVDQPNVGQHLKDHFYATPIVAKAKAGKTLDYLNSRLGALPALARWLLSGSGPFTSNSADAAAFVRSNDDSLPFHYGSASRDEDAQFYGSLGTGPDIEFIGTPMACFEQPSEPCPSEDIFSLGVVGLRPQSEGIVTITSKSVWDKVAIDPRYWSDPNDLAVVIKGVRLGLAILHSAPMQQFLDRDLSKSNDSESAYFPFCADPKQVTDEQIRRWAAKAGGTFCHPVGTARMGKDPQTSVVSPETLKIHGLHNVRVIDASIFPEHIAGHPAAAVTAIAEKASDMIRGRSMGGVAAQQD